jgi:hypothetical protein
MKDVLGLKKLLPYLVFICACIGMILFFPDYPKTADKESHFSSVADSPKSAQPSRNNGPADSQSRSVALPAS